MAVLVQLLLTLDRRDLAQTTYQTAKKIGNDSRLVQAIEAWIGMKTVSPITETENLATSLLARNSTREWPASFATSQKKATALRSAQARITLLTKAGLAAATPVLLLLRRALPPPLGPHGAHHVGARRYAPLAHPH